MNADVGNKENSCLKIISYCYQKTNKDNQEQNRNNTSQILTYSN